MHSVHCASCRLFKAAPYVAFAKIEHGFRGIVARRIYHSINQLRSRFCFNSANQKRRQNLCYIVTRWLLIKTHFLAYLDYKILSSYCDRSDRKQVYHALKTHARTHGLLSRYSVHCHFNPFPNKPWFWRVCRTSLFKTLWEKEKLLVTSNFSFSHSIFYPFRELSAMLINFEIVVCKLFQFGRI